MNRPRLNCYYMDLQLFIRTKHQIPKNKMRVKTHSLWNFKVFFNQIWTDIDIQIDIFHRPLTLIYSHSQFILWG